MCKGQSCSGEESVKAGDEAKREGCGEAGKGRACQPGTRFELHSNGVGGIERF